MHVLLSSQVISRKARGQGPDGAVLHSSRGYQRCPRMRENFSEKGLPFRKGGCYLWANLAEVRSTGRTSEVHERDEGGDRLAGACCNGLRGAVRGQGAPSRSEGNDAQQRICWKGSSYPLPHLQRRRLVSTRPCLFAAFFPVRTHVFQRKVFCRAHEPSDCVLRCRSLPVRRAVRLST